MSKSLGKIVLERTFQFLREREGFHEERAEKADEQASLCKASGDNEKALRHFVYAKEERCMQYGFSLAAEEIVKRLEDCE